MPEHALKSDPFPEKDEMTKRKLAYIWSLRNAAADKAGQQVAYKGELRYMKSPLEFLAESLNRTALGDAYELVGVIYDDDPELPATSRRSRTTDSPTGLDSSGSTRRNWRYRGGA